jgi:hypothetical protein
MPACCLAWIIHERFRSDQCVGSFSFDEVALGLVRPGVRLLRGRNSEG